MNKTLIEFMLIRANSESSARDNDRQFHAKLLFRAGKVWGRSLFSQRDPAFHLSIIKRTRAKLSRVFSAARSASRARKIRETFRLYTGFPKTVCIAPVYFARGTFKGGLSHISRERENDSMQIMQEISSAIGAHSSREHFVSFRKQNLRHFNCRLNIV